MSYIELLEKLAKAEAEIVRLRAELRDAQNKAARAGQAEERLRAIDEAREEEERNTYYP